MNKKKHLNQIERLGFLGVLVGSKEKTCCWWMKKKSKLKEREGAVGKVTKNDQTRGFGVEETVLEL